MKALTILKRCRAARVDIGRLQQRIDQRRDVLTGIGAPTADPIGGGHGTGDTDKTGRILADIDLLERQIAARKEALEAERVSACALLDMVPGLESKVLYKYYVKGMNTTQIAMAEKYTETYVRKRKRAGEKMLGELPPEQVAGTLPPWYLKEKGGD